MMAMDISRMTTADIIAEKKRRDDRRARGLPLEETPAEAEQRLKEEDDRLERLIQADVRKLYIAHGCRVYWLSQARRTKQTPGIPDLWVFCPAVAVAWWHETKTPRGLLSTSQEDFRELCRVCRIPHVIGGVEAAREHLERLGVLKE